MKKIVGTLLVLALVTFSSAALADNVFTSTGAWQAFTPGATTVNFNGIAPADDYVAAHGPVTVGSLSLNAGADYLYFCSWDRAAWCDVNGDSSVESYGDMTITLPGAFDSFAFTFNSDHIFVVTLSNGSSFTVNAGTGQFFGVTSSSTFNSVTISAPGQLENVGTVSYGTDPPITNVAIQTPEPSSLLMLGSGLMATAGFVRRRLKKG
jgi:hypothetical protein